MKKNYIVPVFLLGIYACSGNNSTQINAGGKETKTTSDQFNALGDAGGCDPNKWKFVYDPDRLEVLDKCKTVTGVITERNADEDGDEHMLLKLDKGQNKLLRKKNLTKKDGCLVIEAVCINNITRKRAKGACKGYVNNVFLPKVGDRVRVTGSYVVDSHNGWTEIHPISKVEKM